MSTGIIPSNYILVWPSAVHLCLPNPTVEIASVVISDSRDHCIHWQGRVGQQARRLLKISLPDQLLDIEVGVLFQQTADLVGWMVQPGGYRCQTAVL